MTTATTAAPKAAKAKAAKKVAVKKIAPAAKAKAEKDGHLMPQGFKRGDKLVVTSNDSKCGWLKAE